MSGANSSAVPIELALFGGLGLILLLVLVVAFTGSRRQADPISDPPEPSVKQPGPQPKPAHEAQLAEVVRQLEAQVARLKSSGREVIAQRDAARTEASHLLVQVKELTARLAATPAGPCEPVDARFRELKAAFAKLYHPDRITASGFERTLREQVFKEVWSEIERIERR